jgi:hypothetical protein
LGGLAFKQIAVTAGEALAREVLNNLADSLSNFVLEQFKPKISSTIQNKV